MSGAHFSKLEENGSDSETAFAPLRSVPLTVVWPNLFRIRVGPHDLIVGGCVRQRNSHLSILMGIFDSDLRKSLAKHHLNGKTVILRDLGFVGGPPPSGSNSSRPSPKADLPMNFM